MITRVNKEGTDWLVIKDYLKEKEAELVEQMLVPLSVEEYNRCRGSILMCRELVEWVEPTTPPITQEDDYGYSEEGTGNYT